VKKILGLAISVAILCVSLWFLRVELGSLRLEQVLAQIKAIEVSALFTALVCTFGSYLVLTGYDAVALRYIGWKLSYRQIAQTAFLAFSVGHNVGTAAISGGSIRYRMYSLLGLPGFEIAKVIVFVSVTFALGATLLLGAAMLIMPMGETRVLNLTPAALNMAGALLVAVPSIYLLFGTFLRRPLGIGKWLFSFPSPKIGFAQLGLSVCDITFATATLYVLMPPEAHIGFLAFLGVYVIALGAGLLSSVPGGLGVFEAVLLVALPGVDHSALLGAIIVYRLIYYVTPLCLALVLLTSNEIRRHREMLLASTGKARAWLSSIVPAVVGMMVFLAGIVLLISGATPAVASRLSFIARGIPLPVLELSHLTGSVLGVGLLVLARGLSHRLRGAYVSAVLLLCAGIAASLLKGFDYEEAVILAFILGFLWISRNQFYRTGPVVSQPLTTAWAGPIIFAFCFVAWIAMFSFRHVNYAQDLWWQFALHADAPRMLRAGFLVGLAATSFVLWKLFHFIREAPPEKKDGSELSRVRDVVSNALDSSANAALMGDKRFLWSASGQSFIMYRISGGSWISLGDPVGPASEWEDLVWAFREMVDLHDGHPVFYQIAGESLPLYVDMDLSLAKLGEDARVPLEKFSLEGKKFAEFRYVLNKARKQGVTFEIVRSTEVISVVADLRKISDSWLESKATTEKGFSLGSFSEQYISQFDCAVVRMEGSIVAFANLWLAPKGGEFAIDLMRYSQTAPKGVMDYLFTELMLWGKAEGYEWFSLGMAPLSGLDQHALAPLWHKIGHLIFSHGENFYNFEGLRHYKEKFAPEWRPRYVACRRGLLGLPHALLDASRMISGGVRHMLAK